ncbi:MAG TPA: hypothetical protein VJK54_06050, partial [Chthoniobacterales bacterium]|nr:hypothetical protein [Chthoniobacterales bacterium]
MKITLLFALALVLDPLSTPILFAQAENRLEITNQTTVCRRLALLSGDQITQEVEPTMTYELQTANCGNSAGSLNCYLIDQRIEPTASSEQRTANGNDLGTNLSCYLMMDPAIEVAEQFVEKGLGIVATPQSSNAFKFFKNLDAEQQAKSSNLRSVVASPKEGMPSTSRLSPTRITSIENTSEARTKKIEEQKVAKNNIADAENNLIKAQKETDEAKRALEKTNKNQKENANNFFQNKKIDEYVAAAKVGVADAYYTTIVVRDTSYSTQAEKNLQEMQQRENMLRNIYHKEQEELEKGDTSPTQKQKNVNTLKIILSNVSDDRKLYCNKRMINLTIAQLGLKERENNINIEKEDLMAQKAQLELREENLAKEHKNLKDSLEAASIQHQQTAAEQLQKEMQALLDRQEIIIQERVKLDEKIASWKIEEEGVNKTREDLNKREIELTAKEVAFEQERNRAIQFLESEKNKLAQEQKSLSEQENKLRITKEGLDQKMADLETEKITLFQKQKDLETKQQTASEEQKRVLKIQIDDLLKQQKDIGAQEAELKKQLADLDNKEVTLAQIKEDLAQKETDLDTREKELAEEKEAVAQEAENIRKLRETLHQKEEEALQAKAIAEEAQKKLEEEAEKAHMAEEEAQSKALEVHQKAQIVEAALKQAEEKANQQTIAAYEAEEKAHQAEKEKNLALQAQHQAEERMHQIETSQKLTETEVIKAHIAEDNAKKEALELSQKANQEEHEKEEALKTKAEAEATLKRLETEAKKAHAAEEEANSKALEAHQKAQMIEATLKQAEEQTAKNAIAVKMSEEQAQQAEMGKASALEIQRQTEEKIAALEAKIMKAEALEKVLEVTKLAQAAREKAKATIGNSARYQNSIADSLEKVALYWTKIAEAHIEGNKILVEKYTKVAEQSEKAVKLFTQAAQACEAAKLQEGVCWYEAGKSTQSSTTTMIQASEILAIRNNFLAEKYDKLSEKHQAAADKIAKAAETFAEGKDSEAWPLVCRGMLTRSAASSMEYSLKASEVKDDGKDFLGVKFKAVVEKMDEAGEFYKKASKASLSLPSAKVS